MERLQKILSRAGIASRRASERLVVEGRVTVNGATARELGTKADAAHDDIRVDGRRVTVARAHRYVLLNKPPGYVTTRADPEKRPTVVDLLKGVHEYLYPVGRLDFHSAGLLLLTNDGDLAARLMHPRHEVPRLYEARVLGVPDRQDLERLARGIVIDGRRTAPVSARILRQERTRSGPRAVISLTLHEGRNRQIRRMCDAIGHPVEDLRRVAIGPIRDERLRPGEWRDLSDAEIARLKKAAGEASPAPRPRATTAAATRRRRPSRQ